MNFITRTKLSIRRLWDAYKPLFVLGVVLLVLSALFSAFYTKLVNPELNPTNIFGQTTKEDEEAIARLARPRLKANAHLYAIFCESGNHLYRKKACEAMFAGIIDDLWDQGSVRDAQAFKNAVRAYKRIYDIID